MSRSLSRWPSWLLWGLSVLPIFATLIPISVTNIWWIEVFVFPQAQITILLAVCFVAVLFLMNLRAVAPKLLLAALALCVGYQLYYLLPYSPFHPIQAPGAKTCDARDRVRVLSMNVLHTNRNRDAVLKLVRQVDPDLFFAVETDPWWGVALRPLAQGLPHVVDQTQDGAWGMILFSRLPLEQPQVRHLIDGYVPSIKTGVSLPSGATFTFHGLHPKPPYPGHGTARGDAEVVIVGREIRENPGAAIVAGDFNDVPWSSTSQLFQRVGGLLDPRIGRGFHASFTTANPIMRWPLDHIFVTPSFRVVDFRVLSDIGSDHFPVVATLCYDEAANDGSKLDQRVIRRARQTIEAGRKAAR